MTTNVATAAANDPSKNTVGPISRAFLNNLVTPSFPSTCLFCNYYYRFSISKNNYIMVFIVSTGINRTLNTAAAKEAKIVLMDNGIHLVKLDAFRAAIVPLEKTNIIFCINHYCYVFAAVSPNRLKGPNH